MDQALERDLRDFVAYAQSLSDGFWRGGPSAAGKPRVSVDPSERKWAKIVLIEEGGDGHVYAFVDRGSGAIIEPQDWKSPAFFRRGLPVVVGNIHDKATWTRFDWYGPRHWGR